MGYSTDLLTGVWVGFDEMKKIGEHETSARAAIPIWMEYMKATLSSYEKRDFLAPPGIVFVNIDGKKGTPATSGTEHVVSQPFIEGTVPQEWSGEDERQNGSKEEEEFFKEDM